MRYWLAFIAALVTCPAAGAVGDYDSLVRLAQDWRRFETPAMRDCVPDYGAAAWRRRLPDCRPTASGCTGCTIQGWSAAQLVDQRLIEAEMNGLDFDLRVRQPWARDPSFYATVFGERSDVPQHEGRDGRPGDRPVRLPVPLVACRSAQPHLPARRHPGAAGPGEGEPARQQCPRPVDLRRGTLREQSEVLGSARGRDARHAHPGGHEARKPRRCRQGVAGQP